MALCGRCKFSVIITARVVWRGVLFGVASRSVTRVGLWVQLLCRSKTKTTTRVTSSIENGTGYQDHPATVTYLPAAVSSFIIKNYSSPPISSVPPAFAQLPPHSLTVRASRALVVRSHSSSSSTASLSLLFPSAVFLQRHLFRLP